MLGPARCGAACNTWRRMFLLFGSGTSWPSSVIVRLTYAMASAGRRFVLKHSICATSTGHFKRNVLVHPRNQKRNIVTAGFLRVRSRLVPPDWNGFSCPDSRYGEITAELEYEEFPAIQAQFEMDLHAHFPTTHPIPVSHSYDYMKMRQVRWVNHWTE